MSHPSDCVMHVVLVVILSDHAKSPVLLVVFEHVHVHVHVPVKDAAAEEATAFFAKGLLNNARVMASPFPKVLALFSPFLALFGKARFFRPLLRFLVNIALFELFQLRKC